MALYESFIIIYYYSFLVSSCVFFNIRQRWALQL